MIKNILKKIVFHRFLSVFVLSITIAFFMISSGFKAANRGLWYDELFTFHVASLSSFRQVVSALLELVDNNPPVDYLIRHLFVKSFGDSPFFFRLPSLLFYVAGSFCLYYFVLHRTSRLAAIVAFCFPVFSIALRYSHEGRAYMLLYATSASSLLFWQRSVEYGKKHIYLPLLSMSLVLACYSHFYGVFNYLPLIAGETTRLYRKKRLEFYVFLAIIASMFFLIFLWPFIVNASQFSPIFWSNLYFKVPFMAYGEILPFVIFPFIIFAILIFPIFLIFPENLLNLKSNSEENIVPLHEIVATFVLCVIPFIQYFAAIMKTKAFAPNYAIISVNGFSIMMGYACFFVGKKNYIISVLVAFCFIFSSWALMANDAHENDAHKWKSARFKIDDAVVSIAEKSSLPVVVSSHLKYLQYEYYFDDEDKKKIYFLTDKNEAMKFLGHSSSDFALLHLKKIKNLNLINYKNFKEKNEEYFIVTKNFDDGWLIRKIRDDFSKNAVSIELVHLSPQIKIVKVRHSD